MEVANLEEVTTVDNGEFVIKLSSPATRSLTGRELIWMNVDEGNSGTIQFAVDESTTGKKAWPAGSKVPMTAQLNVDQIRVKGSAAGQKFTPSW